MRDVQDRALEVFEIRARSASEALQRGIWGARWDFSEPSLDYSRASLVRLSEWLRLAALGEAAEAFEDVLGAAGQYFGETILEHALGEWERRPNGVIGVRAYADEVRHIDVVEVLEAWIAAARVGDGGEREVFLVHFDRAVECACPPGRRA